MHKNIDDIVKCYDNGGETFDRFTVILNAQGDYVAMSSYPFHPQGFGQHGEGCEPGEHLGKQITFDELPEDCKKLVLRDLQDGVAVHYGKLAAFCGKKLPLKVLQSYAGFYIGTTTVDEILPLPFTRESQEYFGSEDVAMAAFVSGSWTQRREV